MFFLGRSSKAIETKSKLNKEDLIKLIIFYMAQGTINKIKTHPTDWEKYIRKQGVCVSVCVCVCVCVYKYTHTCMYIYICKQTIQYQKYNSPTIKIGHGIAWWSSGWSSLPNAIDTGLTLVQEDLSCHRTTKQAPHNYFSPLMLYRATRCKY